MIPPPVSEGSLGLIEKECDVFYVVQTVEEHQIGQRLGSKRKSLGIGNQIRPGQGHYIGTVHSRKILLQIAGSPTKFYCMAGYQPRHDRLIPVLIQLPQHGFLFPDSTVMTQNLLRHHTAFRRRNP